MRASAGPTWRAYMKASKEVRRHPLPLQPPTPGQLAAGEALRNLLLLVLSIPVMGALVLAGHGVLHAHFAVVPRPVRWFVAERIHEQWALLYLHPDGALFLLAELAASVLLVVVLLNLAVRSSFVPTPDPWPYHDPKAHARRHNRPRTSP